MPEGVRGFSPVTEADGACLAPSSTATVSALTPRVGTEPRLLLGAADAAGRPGVVASRGAAGVVSPPLKAEASPARGIRGSRELQQQLTELLPRSGD